MTSRAGSKVSIVTVVWNGAATLERTIQSVLAQDHPDIEYIIVDGGSTDGTLDIVRRYEGRISRWVSEKDRGIYDAMNKGIALCTGDWIGLINADDWYEPDTVRTVIHAAATNPKANIVHGDIWIHYPNGSKRIKHAKPNGFLLRYWEMVLNHPSFFVRASYYRAHPFDAAMRVSGDHQWTLKAWLEDPGQFLQVRKPLANFSAGGASMVLPLRKALREGEAMCRNLGLGPFDRLMSALVKTTLYLPRKAKLWFNQFLSPLMGNEQRP